MFKKILFAVAASVLAAQVSATPVTYVFQSDNYTQLNYASDGPGLPGGYELMGPYGIGQSTTISFTLGTALSANSTLNWSGSGASGMPPSLLSYSANTGLHRFSMDQEISLSVTTDASGAISAWDIFFHSPVLADDTTLWSRMESGGAVTDVQYQNEYSLPTSTRRAGPTIGGEYSRASAFGGSWNILSSQAQPALASVNPAPTPIGGTGALLLSGLGLVGFWQWRRRNAA